MSLPVLVGEKVVDSGGMELPPVFSGGQLVSLTSMRDLLDAILVKVFVIAWLCCGRILQLDC